MVKLKLLRKIFGPLLWTPFQWDRWAEPRFMAAPRQPRSWLGRMSIISSFLAITIAYIFYATLQPHAMEETVDDFMRGFSGQAQMYLGLVLFGSYVLLGLVLRVPARKLLSLVFTLSAPFVVFFISINALVLVEDAFYPTHNLSALIAYQATILLLMYSFLSAAIGAGAIWLTALKHRFNAWHFNPALGLLMELLISVMALVSTVRLAWILTIPHLPLRFLLSTVPLAAIGVNVWALYRQQQAVKTPLTPRQLALALGLIVLIGVCAVFGQDYWLDKAISY